MGIRAFWRDKVSRWALLLLFFFSADARADAVRVSWLPNSETDIGGYKVHFGTHSRTYDQHMDVANNTSCIITKLTAGVEYFFCVSAYDTAANESQFSMELSGMIGDTIPPAIMSVQPMSITEIWLLMNEKVAGSTVQDITNYSIDNGIHILRAECLDDQKTIRLFTSAHTQGIHYHILVSNITDVALPPNSILPESSFSYSFSVVSTDTTSPVLVYARPVSDSNLNIYFNETLNPASAENSAHYRIDPEMTVYSARLLKSNVVRLTTSPHQEGIDYKLAVRNVTDNSILGNAVSAETAYGYSLTAIDHLNPFIKLAHCAGVDRIKILFSEPVDALTATEITHYTIHEGVEIRAAYLDASEQVVTLYTSPHVPNRAYTLSVHNIRDKSSAKNPVQSPVNISYLCEPTDSVGPTLRTTTLLDTTHLKLLFNEPLDRDSAETLGHYILADGMNPVSAHLDAAATAIYLETDPHQADHLYQIRISGICDASNGKNRMPETTASYALENGGKNLLFLREIQMQDANHVLIVFSHVPEKSQAENVSHYLISNHVTIRSARVSEDPRVVLLETTSHETDQTYALEINTIANEKYFYSCKGEDTVGPIISMVRPVDPENIDILFNEPVNVQQAVQTLNYSISGDVRILGAHLDASQTVVHLHTTPHAVQKLYLLQANNIVDASPDKNKIIPYSNAMYLFDEKDQQPPKIAMARVLDPESLEITFDEMIDMAAALDKNNYSFKEYAKIVAVKRGTSSYNIEVQTTPLQRGGSYELRIMAISDQFGNRMAGFETYRVVYDTADTLSPVIERIYTNQDGITIQFDRPLNRTYAENIQNYEILPDIHVSTARTDGSLTRVTLQTTAHEPGQQYVLLIDSPEVEGKVMVPRLYTYYEQNLVAPAVRKVEALSESEIILTFSQPVDPLSAEEIGHYFISDGIKIFAVKADAGRTEVRLRTLAHRPGVPYTIEVSGVNGGAGGRIDTAFPYVLWPSLQLLVDGAAQTKLSYLDVGAEYYLDRNYMITQIPEELLHARIIITCNNDKEKNDMDYLLLQLNQPSFVLIAYDTRAAAVPHWLSSQFTRTNLKISVTDQSGTLDIWRNYATSNTVRLGGNNADGARAVKSMYFVILQEATPQLLSQYYKIQPFDTHDDDALPAKVSLYQNYPNPFNPFTHVEFDLPEEMTCKIVVYDILGREVKVLYDARAGAGHHTILWNSRSSLDQLIASGVYFCRLTAWEDRMIDGILYQANYFQEIRKMIYVR